MYQLYLKKNEEKRIVAGGAIIYANEVERIRAMVQMVFFLLFIRMKVDF